MGYLFVLISSVTSLGEGTLIKLYNQKHQYGGFLFTAIVSLFSMIFFLVTDADGLCLDARVLPYAVIAGILYCTASFLTYIALQCGNFAVSMLILSYSMLLTVGYGVIFENDVLSPYAIAGLALVILSLFLVRGRSEEAASRKRVSFKWLVCIGLSAVGSGMFGVLVRMQQTTFSNAQNNEFMAVALGISALVLFIVGAVRDRGHIGEILKKGSLFAAGAGLCNGATNLLGILINDLFIISVASPLRSATKTAVSFLFSLLVFKERFLPRQIVGVALGGVAVILLNF